MEAVAIPLPKLEQTPPVTNIYLVGMGEVYAPSAFGASESFLLFPSSTGAFMYSQKTKKAFSPKT